MPTIKEALLGTDEQNRVAQNNIDRYNLSERARKAFTAAPGEEISDTYNLDTYGPKKMNRESAMKALEAADSEKAREHTRGVKPMKKGGKAMEHKHKMEHDKKHAAGFMHEQDKAVKHASGHKMHHEHVKAMCMGGKAKK
jgi:hypothetical protein